LAVLGVEGGVVPPPLLLPELPPQPEMRREIERVRIVDKLFVAGRMIGMRLPPNGKSGT
jgi:hypothetical protein